MHDASQTSIAFYERDAAVYDERRWRTPVGRYVDETQRAIVRVLVGQCAGKAVLDVATGTGRFAIDLARSGAQVTTLDSSGAMLAVCAGKAIQEGLSDRLTAVRGTATELPFPDSSFDIAICINALNHIPNQQLVMKELSRVVGKGGAVVTNYTNWLSFFLPAGLAVNFRRRSLRADVYTKWFTPAEVWALHRAAGLEVQRIMGAVQIPEVFGGGWSFPLLRQLDRVSRDTYLRRFAPQLFVRARKAIAPLPPETT